MCCIGTDMDCASTTCGTSQDTCTQGWCGDDGHGKVTFTVSAGEAGVPLWSHSAEGDDGMSCFELDLTAARYSSLHFAVSSDGARSCDTASWGDLKTCTADACASIRSCAKCRGGCGRCPAWQSWPQKDTQAMLVYFLWEIPIGGK